MFFRKFISIMLAATLTFFPFTSNAGLIGTEITSGAEQVNKNRDKVQDFLNRADVISKYQAMGLASEISKVRVESLTQDEVNLIAKNIDSLPTGGYITETGGVIIAVTLIIIVWIISRSFDK